TNVGKTTLMRTLLRRDIGAVADRPHVTDEAEGHVLVDTREGDVLRLWDTPGFGDSARLLKRLLASGNPLGWLQSQVWDRFTDRPFFSSQQAVRNVREVSEVVLYLVNAAEDPASAGYVEAEMRILGWIGKPVMVLLNQTGPARGRDADAAEEARWSRELARRVGRHRVMAMDAFARCWVQEDRLLGEVGELLAPERLEAFERLRAAWRERNLGVFDKSMQAIGEQLAATAVDHEPIGTAREQRAMNVLGKRLDRREREALDRLIALHGLAGKAGERILARMAQDFAVSRPADVRKSGVIGGMVSGAIGGLAADLAAAGLTFGAGALIGGILGALGAGGAAHAYNVLHGVGDGAVRWSAELLRQRWIAALLRYLAVAHYGRGRGDWVEGEYPAHWKPLVDEVTAERRAELDAIWAAAEQDAPEAGLGRRLGALSHAAIREALVRLYPAAEEGTFAGVPPPQARP
ncbi:MAG TPA: DUF3482 domain-containing protein, partial [Myxococcota bacterium]|nr:DUF3482 domain-containing protein [Myxococcota bacterium]